LPSRLICVGFARLLVIPSMAQLPLLILTISQDKIQYSETIIQSFFTGLSLGFPLRVFLPIDHWSSTCLADKKYI
jgi:hypothetical protein